MSPAGKALLVAFPKPAYLPFPSSGTVVGRAWLGAVGIVDKEVSTRHCQLIARHGLIRDVGSHNGTFVNGVRLSPGDPPTPLPDGGVIRMGRTLLVYRAEHRGPFEPEEPLGDMTGPFGLRELRVRLDAWAARSPRVVLLEGDTGTGKELAAAAIARRLRPSAPFAAINVTAIAADLFESTLFGHVRGAFSGADRDHAGVVRAHDGGVIFLDEIGDLPVPQQPKLLRLLESQEVLPVGADRPEQVDVLLVVATNRDVNALVEDGALRDDMRQRLRPQVRLPALRDRRADIFALACTLARRHGLELSPENAEVEAVEWLLRQPWPGNVRALEGVIAEARLRDPRPLLRKWALEEALAEGRSAGATKGDRPAAHGVLTRATVTEALARHEGNKSHAAHTLGVSRDQLIRYEKKLAD